VLSSASPYDGRRRPRPRAVLGVCAAALLGLQGATALAEPWVEPGDPRLRADIELLAAYGIIEGPLNTWPVPWAQISHGIAGMERRAYPFHVEAALARVRQAMPQSSDYRGIGVEAELKGTSEQRLVRGFDGGARQEGDISLALDKHWSSTYAKLSVGWRDDQPDGNDFHFDNSYIAQAWGNWVFYGGTLPQWWGGGWDGGLLVSTNARPFARIGLQRLNPRPFETPWLSWLGHWNIHLSAGRLGDERDDFDTPWVVETRITLSPIRGLDLGISRTIQICGEGRPCDLSTFRRAVFAFDNTDNTGVRETDPSNQIFGMDARFARRIGGVSFATFVEVIAEDTADVLPTKWSADLGFTLNGHWAGPGLDWGFRFEASDTEAGNLFGLEVNEQGTVPGVTFNSFIFTDGFTFKERTIGHSLDTDSRLLTAEVNAADRSERYYWLRYRRAVVNATDRSRGNLLSGNREQINLVEAGVTVPFRLGELRLELRTQDDQPDTPGRNDFEAEIEAGLRLRF